MAEVDVFAKVSTMAEFQTVLEQFRNYKKFYRQEIKSRNPMPYILDASNGERILSVKNIINHSMLMKFHAAHVAACCVLFKDEQYVTDMLNSNNIHNYAMKYISANERSKAIKKNDIMQRINALDSVRIIMLLRLLGLIQRPPSSMYQLGLGAGSGVKDYYYVHTLPKRVFPRSGG